VRESQWHAKNEWLAATLWCITVYVWLVIVACAWWENAGGVQAMA
jgi:hypothetical protein